MQDEPAFKLSRGRVCVPDPFGDRSQHRILKTLLFHTGMHFFQVLVIQGFCFFPVLWVKELSAFFSLPCAVRLGVSIKVDTFTSMISKSVQRVLGLICDVVMVVFLCWLLKGTAEIITNAAAVNQASPALGIPIANVYSAMAFGIFLGILRYIQLIYKVVTKKTEKEDK